MLENSDSFVSYDSYLPEVQRPSKWRKVFDRFLASDDKCIKSTFSDVNAAKSIVVSAHRYVKSNKIENIRIARRGSSVFIIKE